MNEYNKQIFDSYFLKFIVLGFLNLCFIIYLDECEWLTKIHTLIFASLNFIAYYFLTPTEVFFSELTDKTQREVEQPVLIAGSFFGLSKFKNIALKNNLFSNYFMRLLVPLGLWFMLYRITSNSYSLSSSLFICAFLSALFFASFNAFIWAPVFFLSILTLLFYSSNSLHYSLTGISLITFLIIYRSALSYNLNDSKSHSLNFLLTHNLKIYIHFLIVFITLSYLFNEKDLREKITKAKSVTAEKLAEYSTKKNDGNSYPPTINGSTSGNGSPGTSGNGSSAKNTQKNFDNEYIKQKQRKTQEYKFLLDFIEKLFRILLVIFAVFVLYSLFSRKKDNQKPNQNIIKNKKKLKKILMTHKNLLNQKYSSKKEEITQTYHSYLTLLALDGIIKLDAQTPLQFQMESKKWRHPLKIVSKDLTHFFYISYYGETELSDAEYLEFQKIKRTIVKQL